MKGGEGVPVQVVVGVAFGVFVVTWCVFLPLSRVLLFVLPSFLAHRSTVVLRRRLPSSHTDTFLPLQALLLSLIGSTCTVRLSTSSSLPLLVYLSSPPRYLPLSPPPAFHPPLSFPCCIHVASSSFSTTFRTPSAFFYSFSLPRSALSTRPFPSLSPPPLLHFSTGFLSLSLPRRRPSPFRF